MYDILYIKYEYSCVNIKIVKVNQKVKYNCYVKTNTEIKSINNKLVILVITINKIHDHKSERK